MSRRAWSSVLPKGGGTMVDDPKNSRRGPRAAIRCDVELRHRLVVWSGETEDVGPGGCRIVSPRSVDRGRTVKLAIRCAALPRTLLVFGRVVWVRGRSTPGVGPRTCLGLAFEGGADAAAEWFERLVAARTGIGLRDPAAPARLAPAARVALAAAGPAAASRARTPEVQRLYDEALSLIGNGRLTLALDRLQDALKHAPEDATISSTAKRIARWA
jgi:hypothetical protein